MLLRRALAGTKTGHLSEQSNRRPRHDANMVIIATVVPVASGTLLDASEHRPERTPLRVEARIETGIDFRVSDDPHILPYSQ